MPILYPTYPIFVSSTKEVRNPK